MARIEIAVEVNGIYSYEARAYGYGYETRYIYNMAGEDGTVYVWKTASVMEIKVYEGVDERTANFTDDKGRAYIPEKINKGDKIIITASVKGEGEYNGNPQTILTRVKIKERTFRGETDEERRERLEAEKEAKAKQQLDSLSGEDFVWRMPYRQFKTHYSDCETVFGSFNRNKRDGATIAVIIREGRLKASGVRGRRYYGFRFKNEIGECVVYRAVSEENALKRANKEYPNDNWKLDRIFEYTHSWDI